MANEVQVAFSEALDDKLTVVAAALPSVFNKTRFIQNGLAFLNSNPDLAKINRADVIQGLLKGAYLGLDFMNKECYLIAYEKKVQFQTDYKGEIKLVKRYSIRKIKDIFAKVVREGDFFEEAIVDSKPVINFRPVPFSNGEIRGVFAMVLYEDGGCDYETMSVEDVNAVRANYSKASQSKAWKCSFDEMAKKTVLRRLCKHIETDFESAEARTAWEEGSGMNFVASAEKTTAGDVVDVFDVKEVPVE